MFLFPTFSKEVENKLFVLVIAWFRVQVMIYLTSGNYGAS